MMKFILGRKSTMTQMFTDDGKVMPVTVVHAGPCVVTQVKTDSTDGYIAVQVGFEMTKKARKPQRVALKALEKDGRVPRTLKEVRVKDVEGIEVGQSVTVDVFQVGDFVKVTGTTKGKGFQGVVKRHGFHGSPATHGHRISCGCQVRSVRVVFRGFLKECGWADRWEINSTAFVMLKLLVLMPRQELCCSTAQFLALEMGY